METSISYCGGEYAYFSSDERKWHFRIRRLAESYPGDVIIIKQPEENDGCIYAKILPEYVKIAPKRKLNLTDEQRDAARARMEKLIDKQRTENVDEQKTDA